LAANGTLQISIGPNAFTNTGFYVITATVDYQDLIYELDETNNTATRTFTEGVAVSSDYYHCTFTVTPDSANHYVINGHAAYGYGDINSPSFFEVSRMQNNRISVTLYKGGSATPVDSWTGTTPPTLYTNIHGTINWGVGVAPCTSPGDDYYVKVEVSDNTYKAVCYGDFSRQCTTTPCPDLAVYPYNISTKDIGGASINAIHVGEQVFVSAKVLNVGSQDTLPVEGADISYDGGVSWDPAGNALPDFAVPITAAGGSAVSQVASPWTPSVAGTYLLCVSADRPGNVVINPSGNSYGDISECNEGNNNACKEFGVVDPLPDIAIIGMSVDKAPDPAPTPVNVTVKIQNAGLEAIPAGQSFPLCLYVDSVTTPISGGGCITVDGPMVVGETREYSYTWTPEIVERRFLIAKADLSGTNYITEENETVNNSFAISLPDLVAVDITVPSKRLPCAPTDAPALYYQNNSIDHVLLNTHNRGGMTFTSPIPARLVIAYNGTTLYSEEFDITELGIINHPLVSSLTFSDLGDYTFELTIDNAPLTINTEDAAYANNTLVKTITVIEPKPDLTPWRGWYDRFGFHHSPEPDILVIQNPPANGSTCGNTPTTLRVKIRNWGDYTTSSFNVNLYHEDSSEQLVTPSQTVTMAPNTCEQDVDFTFDPSSLPSGNTYYKILVDDNPQQIDESNEANNEAQRYEADLMAYNTTVPWNHYVSAFSPAMGIQTTVSFEVKNIGGMPVQKYLLNWTITPTSTPGTPEASGSLIELTEPTVYTVDHTFLSVGDYELCFDVDYDGSGAVCVPEIEDVSNNRICKTIYVHEPVPDLTLWRHINPSYADYTDLDVGVPRQNTVENVEVILYNRGEAAAVASVSNPICISLEAPPLLAPTDFCETSLSIQPGASDYKTIQWNVPLSGQQNITVTVDRPGLCGSSYGCIKEFNDLASWEFNNVTTRKLPDLTPVGVFLK